MRKHLWILRGFLFLLCIATAYAEPKWIHVPSTDFEIFSTAGTGDTMTVLRHFEEVRSFFIQSSGSAAITTSAEPVRIIVFGSEKEYIPYRPSEAAVAFYTQIAGRDYIVLNGVNEHVFTTSVHEYVHLVAQHSHMNLPPWLNEGIADTYSTLRPEGKNIIIGNLITGHLYEIGQGSWVPLQTIFNVDHKSAYYNEKNKVGAFYAESWALTHMLMLDPHYAPHFRQFLLEANSGKPTAEVIAHVYGKKPEDFDKEVRGYILGGHLSGGIVPAKLDGTADAHPEPAQIFDVKLALLDLLERPGKEDTGRKGLIDLAAEFPQRPEPHSALGYIAWRTGERADALKEFQQAVDLGGRNPQMLWDYGRMQAANDQPGAIRTLNLLASADAARVDVRLDLAQLYSNTRQWKDALRNLGEIRHVQPSDAARLFRIWAYANLNSGDAANAKGAATRWKDSALNDEDRANAEKFIRYIEASTTPRPMPVEHPVTTSDADAVPDTGRPVMRRSDTEPEKPTRQIIVLGATPALPSVAGQFVEFNCAKPQQRLILKTPEGRVAFLMDDPQKVFVRGVVNMDFYCGPQKTTPTIWIEYEPAPASETDVRGIARYIHYEAPGEDPAGRR